MSEAVKPYDAPKVKDLGSLEELTQQGMNKIGSNPDTFTVITNGIVVGSLTNAP